MNIKLSILSVISAAMLLGGCGKPAERYVSFDGFALGTSYHISARCADSAAVAGSIAALFDGVENSMSLHRRNSRIERLNRGETDSLDTYIKYCVEMAAGLSEISGGLYDITVKPLTDAWGFVDRAPDQAPDVDSLLQFVGYGKIRIEGDRLVKDDPRVAIDLNSIAKGYACDLMGAMLEQQGVTDYLVEIGGEIFCRGINSRGTDWVVAVDRPIEGNMIKGTDTQAIIRISGKGMATSGNYRRFHTDAAGNKVVHTLNPLTGYSQPGNLLSATVIAENCALADGWATMLMVSGVERSKELLASHPEIMAYLIFSDGNDDFATFATDNLSDLVTPVPAR